MIDETRLRHRFEVVRGQLDERGLRLMAAAEARAAGYGGIAAVARWPSDLGLPLSTRNLEVEHDRASLVLPHHPDLARPSAHQPCGRRGSDRRDHDDERADSGLRAGPAALCEGDQD